MTQNTTTVPKWIILYLWATAFITIGASLAGYLKPDALFGTWEALSAAGSLSLAGPLGLFVARNFGTAAVSVFALVKKNASMIQLLLILRIISDGRTASTTSLQIICP